MKILVTGFEPFEDEPLNPSWETVRRLPDTIHNLMNERSQGLRFLQGTKADGVGRTHVDHEVVGKRVKDIDDAEVIVDRGFVRRVLILSDVDSHAAAGHMRLRR